MKLTTRQVVFDLLDKEGYLGTAVVAKRLGIPYGTASSCKSAWKKARGYPVGTQTNPLRELDGSKGIGQCIFTLLDEEPHLKPSQIAERLGVTTTTANGAWQRWKKARRITRPVPLHSPKKPPHEVKAAQKEAPILVEKETPTPTASDIADALLKRAVKAIDEGDYKDDQLRVAKKRIASLEQDNKKLAEEVTRILRLHNEQVNSRDTNLMESVGEVSAIMAKAKMRD